MTSLRIDSPLLTALALLTLAIPGCSDSGDADVATGATAAGGTTGASGGTAAQAGGTRNTTATTGGQPSGVTGGASSSGGVPNNGGVPSNGGMASSGGSGNGGMASSGGSGSVKPPPNPNAKCDTSELLAFPCAEGYGKNATGGRGGDVYEVTTLEASGPGSFGAGLKSGNTVVFRVSGTITGRFDLPSDITIAGQTAPGDGIAINGQLGLNSNVIVRYIRVRFDGKGDEDAIGVRYKKNIILDHISSSWSRDEVMSLYHNENVTIQWSIASQACPNTGTESHRFGGIWGNELGTYHHNLIAHNESRNIRWASGCGNNDYRNNVVYNWGYRSAYGGEAHQVNDKRNPKIEHSTVNMVANYYKPGPGTTKATSQIVNPSSRGGDADGGSYHVAGNVMVGSDEVTKDNWKGVNGTFKKLDTPWDAMPIREQTAEAAYEAVLADVGSTMPARDSLDATIVEDAKTGTAKIGKTGFVSCPADAVLPTLNSTPAPTDADHDGMPDAWETANGLDPNNADDRNQTWGPGYTMLEKYLNSIDSFKD